MRVQTDCLSTSTMVSNRSTLTWQAILPDHVTVAHGLLDLDAVSVTVWGDFGPEERGLRFGDE
ncbi:MAG: hypothetical protein OXI81_02020 [Paracoccaceae bacterium]|nr:hypothetical protein [Paracoccaceae bacterium]